MEGNICFSYIRPRNFSSCYVLSFDEYGESRGSRRLPVLLLPSKTYSLQTLSKDYLPSQTTPRDYIDRLKPHSSFLRGLLGDFVFLFVLKKELVFLYF